MAADGHGGKEGRMEVRVQGSGGTRGWPEPGCRCAPCQRARAAGTGRAPVSVIVDGVLRLAGPHAAALTGNAPLPEWDGGTGRELAACQVTRLAGGWDVTAPDGGRLLCADGRGPAPAVPPGTRRYDVALLDLLGDPAQLGQLRGQGVVTSGTAVAVLFADHRVVSERELLRRGHIWRVAVPRDGDTFCVPAPGAVAAPGAVTAPEAVTPPGGGPGWPRRWPRPPVSGRSRTGCSCWAVPGPGSPRKRNCGSPASPR